MSKPHRILVVDDEHSVRWAFERALQKAGYEVALAENGKRGLATFVTFRPNLTLLDIRMPEIGGLEVLQRIREQDPQAMVIIMTAHGDMDTTVNAMKLGAYDFLAKPFDIDQCLALIKRGLEAQSAFEEQHLRAPGGVEGEHQAPHSLLIGTSPKMQEVFKLIGKVATEDVTVLITGESGSGKELVAQAIHDNSKRATKPFWAINCTAIPENLMESELFGHEKGAFTGATGSKAGTFELAQGGTLFLDEIGDMSLEMQAKLLRVLEEREIVRVGGGHKIKVDVRIIAATNKDLRRAIVEHRFRDDLFHRLKVIEIVLPPLRERSDDIPTLATHFMSHLSQGRNIPGKKFSAETMAALTAYAWPGNVRELKNAIDQAFTLSRDQLILPEHLPQEVRRASTAAPSGAGVTIAPNAPPTGPVTVAPAPTAGTAVLPGTAPVPIGPAPNGVSAPVTTPLAPTGTAPRIGADNTESGQDDVARLVTRHMAGATHGQVHEQIMVAVERELLAQALRQHKGNQVQTAAYLGITRNTLRAKIEKYGL